MRRLSFSFLATVQLTTLSAALHLLPSCWPCLHALQRPCASAVRLQIDDLDEFDDDDGSAPSGFGGFGQYISDAPAFDDPEWDDWDEAGSADPSREGGIAPKEVLSRRRSTLRRWAEFVQNVGVDAADGGEGDEGAPLAPLVEMRNVSLQLGERRVLRPQSWAVREGQRVGVLGESGCGKSMQLQLLAGRREASAGEVHRREGLSIELVSQDAAAELRANGANLRHFLRDALETGQRRSEAVAAAAVAAAAAEEEEEGGGKVAESVAAASPSSISAISAAEADLLRQLPPPLRTPSALASPLSVFSSGQLVRVAVAAAVARRPELLLLDEPTNHLDLEGIEWLEAALAAREGGAIVIVSHDRQVLEQVATHMLDSAGGDGLLYGGSYSQFVKAAATRAEMRRQIASAETQLSAEEVAADGGSGSGLAEQAVASARRAPTRFRIEGAPGMAKKARGESKAPMLEVSSAQVSFASAGEGGADSPPVLSNVSLRVYRGEVVLLLGDNGAGKSTLLKACLGEVPLEEGSAALSATARPFYFAQEAAQAMVVETPGLTPAEWLAAAAPSSGAEARVRTLKRMGFPREAQDRPLSALSGGEKSRLVLCRLLLSRANLLLLDEPTNHLDLTAREYLQEAVRYFDGAVLLVSHDRYFAARLATRIAELREGGLYHCAGGYAAYLEQRQELRERLSSREVEGMAPLLEPQSEQSSRQKRKQRAKKRAR